MGLFIVICHSQSATATCVEDSCEGSGALVITTMNQTPRLHEDFQRIASGS